MFGKIISVQGLGESVIVLVIEDEMNVRQAISAEGRLTALALIDAFGSVADSIGQEIAYELTDYGNVLASFSPFSHPL